MAMSPQLLGIIIGGLVPMILFAFGGPLIKATTQEGIGIGLYLICVGLAVVLVGVGFHAYFRDSTISMRSAAYAVGVGLTWGMGAGLVGIAVMRYPVPIAKLIPLYNMNTLIGVLLALWIFAEWKNVHLLKLLIGAILVVLGGTLVALA